MTDVPLEYVQQALGLDPQNPMLYALAAEMASQENRPALAREYWDAARVRAHSDDARQRVSEVARRLGISPS